MTNTQIIQCAILEIENKSFGVTEQFLDIHELIYEDGKPKVERVDTDKEDIAVVYFPVKNEKFYFAIRLETIPELKVMGVDVESNNCVYFKAISEVYDAHELSSMKALKTTSSVNRGDKRRTGSGIYRNSVIRLEPNPEPDEFEDKLRKLLDYLEEDKEGVKKLVDKANGFIQVAIMFHTGNTMLGGPYIGQETLQRMSALNLAIGFDLYAEGNPWKD